MKKISSIVSKKDADIFKNIITESVEKTVFNDNCFVARFNWSPDVADRFFEAGNEINLTVGVTVAYKKNNQAKGKRLAFNFDVNLVTGGNGELPIEEINLIVEKLEIIFKKKLKRKSKIQCLFMTADIFDERIDPYCEYPIFEISAMPVRFDLKPLIEGTF